MSKFHFRNTGSNEDSFIQFNYCYTMAKSETLGSSGILLVHPCLYPSHSDHHTNSLCTHAPYTHIYTETHIHQSFYNFFKRILCLLCYMASVCHSDSPVDVKDKEAITLLKKHTYEHFTCSFKPFPPASLAFGCF